MALVRVGTTALRDPDGNFLPSVPLYADLQDNEVEESRLTKTAEKSCDEFLKIFGVKINKYIYDCKNAGIEIGD